MGNLLVAASPLCHGLAVEIELPGVSNPGLANRLNFKKLE